MYKQENKQMGKEPDSLRSKLGRPRLSQREYDKSSQENLPENWTRATFIVREDRLKRLKDYAYTDRRTLKDIVNEMIDQYLEGKEIIEQDAEQMIQTRNINAFPLYEISELFDVTPQTLRKHLKEGRIQAVKLGGKWVITDEAMQSFLLRG